MKKFLIIIAISWISQILELSFFPYIFPKYLCPDTGFSIFVFSSLFFPLNFAIFLAVFLGYLKWIFFSTKFQILFFTFASPILSKIKGLVYTQSPIFMFIWTFLFSVLYNFYHLLSFGNSIGNGLYSYFIFLFLRWV